MSAITPKCFFQFTLTVLCLLAITVLPITVQSHVLAKMQLTILDSDRRTIVASGPSGVVGTVDFGSTRASASTSHLIYLWNTGSQGYWIAQGRGFSSLSSINLPLGAVLTWNLTESVRLNKNSSPLPVLLTLAVGSGTGEFNFQIAISPQQTP